MKDVIVIGGRGHAKVVADIVLSRGDRVLGFLDDDKDLPALINNIPLLGPVSDFVKYPDACFVIGIGNCVIRRKISKMMQGVQWYTAVHPNALVSPMDTAIGEGTVVAAGAVINPGAKIGDHCIINTTAVVEHDDQIGHFAHISVGAKLAGTVTIGDGTWVGIGAVVSNNLAVCGDCMIGAGAVVVHSIDAPGTYVGVPARRIK